MWLLSLFFWFSNTATSQAYFPQFQVQRNITPRPASLDTQNPYRIKIFPHDGPFTLPHQSAEKIQNEVRVESKNQCRLTRATKTPQGSWVPQEETLDDAFTDFLFQTRDPELAQSAQYLKCDQGFTVFKDSAPTRVHYEGDLVAKVQNGKVILINLITRENYLRGVVPTEIPATWNMETLKAQAIAARTYAEWTIKNAVSVNQDFDMDDTVQYQAYLGTNNSNPRINDALKATADQVLLFEGSPALTYFSADAGGFTESARDRFGVELSYCPAQKENYRSAIRAWEMKMGRSNVEKILKAGKLIPQNVTLMRFFVNNLDRTESGRVRFIHAEFTNSKRKKIEGSAFRFALGLRSTFFGLESLGIQLKDRQFVFSGKGSGHGVGLSQVGAENMANEGKSFDVILSFYYPGTQRVTLP